MARSEPDPYAILGVPRTATRAVIGTAYRRLARLHHPDTGAPASQAMRDVNWAWAILSDSQRRAGWDARHTVTGAAAGHWSATPRPTATPQSWPAAGWSDAGGVWTGDSGGRVAGGIGCLSLLLASLFLAAFVLFGALTSDLTRPGSNDALQTGPPTVSSAPVP